MSRNFAKLFKRIEWLFRVGSWIVRLSSFFSSLLSEPSARVSRVFSLSAYEVSSEIVCIPNSKGSSDQVFFDA